jgi:hypothetical protein
VSADKTFGLGTHGPTCLCGRCSEVFATAVDDYLEGRSQSLKAAFDQRQAEQSTNADIPEHMRPLANYINSLEQMLYQRGRKYGPNNLAEFGQYGILVRMSDKMARLRNGFQDHSDETLKATLEDVAGYALCWLMMLGGDWPEGPHQAAIPPF